MWGYQSHFRSHFKLLANNVIKELGEPSARAECLLVGARIPNRENCNDVCIEPEDSKWGIKLFDGLLNLIEMEVANHELRNVVYGDEPSMRDKPENIRRDSVRIAVEKTLVKYDLSHGVRSFVGKPAPVDAFYVVPVLQVPMGLFERFRPLPKAVSDGYLSGYTSPIHAALSQVLDEAHDDLLRPDPGRSVVGRSRSPREVARRAADRFMQMPSIALTEKGYGGTDLFERFNTIASLMYEGAKGAGRLLLANPERESIEFFLKFAVPVPFREPRWARKVLEMASPQTSLIADCEKIFGLGKVRAGVDPWETQDVFEIEFLDHCHWHLSCGDEVMLVSRYGAPSLAQELVPDERLSDTYQRLFSCARHEDLSHFKKLFQTAIRQRRGSTLVVAQDAAEEAGRLQGQGTRVERAVLTPELFCQVSSIDGAILLDPHGVCHAVGVILDGAARSDCTPSRGSRYNSAIRYVGSTDTPRLAVVVSDDRTVDVIPLLRPRIKPSAIENTIVVLESATKDNYHPSIGWLDDHRFYLTQEQCHRINAALERIRSEPREVGEIMIIWNEFVPDREFDETYYDTDDPS